MKSKLFVAAVVLTTIAMAGSDQSHASTIGPNDFGSGAVVQTFDSFTPGTTGPGYSPLVANGVSYDIGQYFIASCVTGPCLSNYADYANLTITLDNPANLVGGYLYNSGYINVGYYDASGVLVGSGETISLDNGVGVDFFFGFESLSDPIKTISMSIGGLSRFELDNFTSEIVTSPPATPLPASLPLFATGLGGLGLLGWLRKWKGSSGPCVHR